MEKHYKKWKLSKAQLAALDIITDGGKIQADFSNGGVDIQLIDEFDGTHRIDGRTFVRLKELKLITLKTAPTENIEIWS